MGLSSLGSGKRIENYERRRSSAFSRLKTSYGKYLEDIYNPFSSNKKKASINFNEVEKIKNKTRDRRRYYKLFINILIVVGVGLLFYLIYIIWAFGTPR